MASLFSFGEDNGTATGNPNKGTTRTFNRTESNWKNIDDSTTAYSTVPIQAGGNSYTKYQFGGISGTFNQLSNGKFGHTSGTFGAGLTLVGSGTSGYATPATGTFAGSGITAASALTAAFIPINFATGGPEGPGQSSLSSVNTGYSNYFVTQLQTTTGASPGDTATVELTFQYDES